MANMRENHLLGFDLNLLNYLYALLKERHITRAAEKCLLTQPAMSRAFFRLREELGDEILVRSGKGYERTPRGERLLQELEDLLPRLEAALRGSAFAPETSQERFQVVGTDHVAASLMPGLVRRCRMIAPHILVELARWGDDGYQRVESGACDLALGVGSAPNPPASLRVEVAYEEEFVCLVDAADPHPGDESDLKSYLKRSHAQVSVTGGEQTLVDRPLREIGRPRNVAFSSPYFVPTIMTAVGTDLVVTVPKLLANTVAGLPGLRRIAPPKEIRGFPYVMAWHPRLTGDPAHAWFRQEVREAVRIAEAASQ